MTTPAPPPPAAPAGDERLERIVERVYAVPGVVDVRAWLWEEKLFVAVRPAPNASAEAVVRAASHVAQALAEPGELVEVGLLASD
jgi:hypothetical protein